MKDLASIFLESIDNGKSVQDALQDVDEAIIIQIDALRDVIQEFQDDIAISSALTLKNLL